MLVGCWLLLLVGCWLVVAWLFIVLVVGRCHWSGVVRGVVRLRVGYWLVVGCSFVVALAVLLVTSIAATVGSHVW